MNVFVTGANGLLATHVIEQLLSEGHRVRGLIRNPGKYLLDSDDRLELIRGSLEDSNTYADVLPGCDAVIHIAALTAPEILSYDGFHQVNVRGTTALLEHCLNSGVSRFVYVSTANTLGYGSKEQPGHEELPMSPPFTQSLYAVSKKHADMLVRSYANRLQVVLAHPTFMIGAYDAKPSSGRILLSALKRIVPVPPGGKNFVNARDAAGALLRLLDKGENGRSYLIAGENLSYREFFSRVRELEGVQSRQLPLPAWLLSKLGGVGDGFRYMGFRTPMSSVNLATLCVGNYYHSLRIQEELGVRFRPIEEGLVEALDWFREHGYLRG